MNDVIPHVVPWAWLIAKATAFLLLSLSSVDIVVVAYQQF